MMSLRKRMRDVTVNALIAILLVAAFAVYVIETHDATKVRNWTPVIQVANTVLVFAFLIQWFRHAWSRNTFWAVLSVLLLVHITAYVLFLSRIHQLPVVYYALLDAIELGAFQRILVFVCSTRFAKTGRNGD
jgi:hypothetical protein